METIEDLEKDLRLNASMLARQCDLAREAETKMMAERSRCLKAVDDEPELRFGFHDKGVAFAKKNIRKRIEV
jgi:hypothetical protein